MNRTLPWWIIFISDYSDVPAFYCGKLIKLLNVSACPCWLTVQSKGTYSLYRLSKAILNLERKIYMYILLYSLLEKNKALARTLFLVSLNSYVEESTVKLSCVCIDSLHPGHSYPRFLCQLGCFFFPLKTFCLLTIRLLKFWTLWEQSLKI